jgi:hypothetical protein
MSKNPSILVDTPIGDLEWVIISGEGSEDLNGNMKYKASMVLDLEKQAHSEFVAMVKDFWNTNKPKAFKKAEADSMGLYPHRVPTGNKDENGDPIYEETGKVIVVFKTGTTFKDGKPKTVKVFNAKGAEVLLGDKKIANGSRGRLGGVMAIYTTTDRSGNKIVNSGVTFYLNKVQLTKFVEFVGEGFDAIEDAEVEEAFEGTGDMGAVVDDEVTETATIDKPRLD